MNKQHILRNMTLAVAVAAAVGFARIAATEVLRVAGMTVGGGPGLSKQAGAVVNLKSTAITNDDSTPVVLNSCILEKAVLREFQGFANITNGDNIGSTYRICRIRSNDRLSQVLIYCPAIAGAIANIGLYDTAANGGAAVQAAGIAAAQTLVAALAGLDVTFQSGTFLGLITNAEKRVWEALGLASDPGKDYDLTLTLTAAATATGVALVRVAVAAQV